MNLVKQSQSTPAGIQASLLAGLSAVWYAGCAGQIASVHRRIRLINQLALLGFSATFPYQLFYLVYDLAATVPAFLTNLLFMGLYALVPWLNHTGSHAMAARLAIVASLGHILIITVLVGAATGAYLFYIPLASLLLLQSARFTQSRSAVWLGLLALLALSCHFLAPGFAPPVALDAPVLHAMYGMSVGLTVVGTGMTALMFRIDIEKAEREQASVREELERLSGVDQLTQLANRRRLDQHLRAEWSRMQRSGVALSVLMIDIDRFKRFNDHYGHQAGDDCLRKIAAALQAVVWRPGDLVARYGGEEFVIILPGTDLAGARNLAEQARQSVRRAGIAHADSDVAEVVTISIGVATSIINDSCDDLLRRADEALYEAKHRGRDRVHVAGAGEPEDAHAC